MKVVIDTNVLMSGIFFKGPPHDIINLWQENIFELFVSEEILDEYTRVADELSEKLSSSILSKILNLLSMRATIVEPVKLPHKICVDEDDDKFIACALAGKATVIVSGDKHLLDQNGVFNLEILKPRMFLDAYFP